MEAKSVEVWSEIGNGGVCVAERSGGIFRVVVLAKPSLVWLMNSMETLIKGVELRIL